MTGTLSKALDIIWRTRPGGEAGVGQFPDGQEITAEEWARTLKSRAITDYGTISTLDRNNDVDAIVNIYHQWCVESGAIQAEIDPFADLTEALD